MSGSRHAVGKPFHSVPAARRSLFWGKVGGYPEISGRTKTLQLGGSHCKHRRNNMPAGQSHLDLSCHIEVETPVALISAGHLGRACHYVGEHMRKHAHRAYGAASMPQEVRGASRVAEIIKAEALRRIGTREIQRRGLVGLQSAREIAPAFAVLEGAGWIAHISGTGPGRPARVYAVNPKVEAMG